MNASPHPRSRTATSTSARAARCTRLGKRKFKEIISCHKELAEGVYSSERQKPLILSGNQLRFKPEETHEKVRQHQCAVRVCAVCKRVSASSTNTSRAGTSSTNSQSYSGL